MQMHKRAQSFIHIDRQAMVASMKNIMLKMCIAHPRVMAYVMQGGLQSLQEAVHYSVPVVAIPFFGDQLFNARKILDAGIGLTLDIDTMTESSIVQTLREIVENKTYLNNIKTMSAIVKDELIKPMEIAVWNVEHVLKFPNSRHLRYHGRDMSWIDYYAAYLYLSGSLALLLYIGYILNMKNIGIFIKSKWINVLKRKLD